MCACRSAFITISQLLPDTGRFSCSNLGNPRAQIASHQILVSLQLSLNYDQGKVCLGIHVARHLLDFLDLGLDPLVDALEQAVRRPS